MKRWIFLLSLAMVCGGTACKNDENNGALLQNNDNNDNNDNNGTNGNNTSNNTANNGNNSNNNVPGEIIEVPTDFDYSGEIPTFSGNGEVGQFVHDVNVAECEALFGCVEGGSAMFLVRSLRVATVGDCVDALNARRPPEKAQDAADSEMSTFDSSMSEQCLTDIAEQGCSLIPYSFTSTFAVHDSCRAALLGASNSGTECDGSWECGDGLYCGGAGTDCLGLCSGDSITERQCNETTCQYDQTCDFENSTCGDLGEAGASCFNSTECAFGFVCSEGSGCIEMTLVDEGSACNEQYLCRPGMTCRGGTCQPLVSAGESCGTFTDCDWATVCNRGTCEDATGQASCERDSDCASGKCADTTCIPAGGSCYDAP